MEIASLIYALKIIEKVFTEEKKDIWLMDGTLLGMVRDKKLIPWDTDIDLAMWEKDYHHRIFNKLKERFQNSKRVKVYKLPDSICVVAGDMEIDINLHSSYEGYVWDLYIFPKGILGKLENYILWCLDLYPHEIKKDIIPPFITRILVAFFKKLPTMTRIQLIGMIEKDYKNRSIYYTIKIPDKFFKNLKEIDIYGATFKIPKESEEFLTYKYGPNWKTPEKRKGLSGGFLAGSSVDEVCIYRKGIKEEIDIDTRV